jgi:hypothetical protein
VLKGVEADILQDGRVDFDDAVLARLDFVIASVHSRFNMSEREMTARMLAAMDNPHLTIIGHPTGRLLLSRDPYGVDLDAVIEKAAATGVALEINADPTASTSTARAAAGAEAGAPISIGADAHSRAGIRNVEMVSRWRARWLGRDDILNARPVEGIWRTRRAAAVKAQPRPASAQTPAKRKRAERAPRSPPAPGVPDADAPWTTVMHSSCSAPHSVSSMHRRAGEPGHAPLFRKYPTPCRARPARHADVELIIRPTGFFLQQDEEPDRDGPGRRGPRRVVPAPWPSSAGCPASGERPPTSSSATPLASTRESPSTPTSPGSLAGSA